MCHHLKQIGVTVFGHENVHRFFPSGGWGSWWVGEPDRGIGKIRPGGWIFNILNYIDQIELLVRDRRWSTQGASGKA